MWSEQRTHMEPRRSRRPGAVILGLVALLLLAPLALAGSPSANHISWWTVDGGGGESSGEGFVLAGTAGQRDAAAMRGGDYVLHSGFWYGESPAPEHTIYLPSALRH